MGSQNRVLLNTDGKIVVGESDYPQVTNDTGGSCCCSCPVSRPNNISDSFTGLDQQTNLFATNDSFVPYPFVFPDRRQPYVNHQPALPYTPDQLQNDNANYQMIVLKSGQGKNGGKENALMWNGRDTLSHPWSYFSDDNRRVFKSNLGDTLAKVKHSDFNASFSNYTPNDSTQSWRTAATIIYGEGCPSHGLAYNFETGQNEKPSMGFIRAIGIYTTAPLYNTVYTFGRVSRPDISKSVKMVVTGFSQVLPNANPDFVQGEDEPFLLFPYVYEEEKHLKKVRLTWNEPTDEPSPFGGFKIQSRAATLFLPIQSGDELAIETNVIDHQVTKIGNLEYGYFRFCVRFLVAGVPLLTVKAAAQSSLATGSAVPVYDNDAFQYLCSFGHGVILNGAHGFEYAGMLGYYEKWNEWALANEPTYWNIGGRFVPPSMYGDARWFSWHQNNVGNGTFILNPTTKRIYMPDYAPRVGGFDSYNHTMSSSLLDFNCGLVNEPNPVVMQNFADATGRPLDPPASDTPTPPPATLNLTYPYNWSNISTISATNFPAVLTGATSPLTFTIETGSLPPSGISLGATNGLVSGTAASSGSGTVSIKVTDANGDTATSPVYSWNVTGSGGAGGGGAGSP